MELIISLYIVSNSPQTSFVSDIKEESLDNLNEESKTVENKPNISQKKSETSVVHKIDIGNTKMRKHTTSQNVADNVQLNQKNKVEVSSASNKPYF